MSWETTVREYRSGRALCMCGCGTPVRIVANTDPSRGVKKGEPRKWIYGHQRRTQVACIVDQETGCWNWQSVDKDGYPRLAGRWHLREAYADAKGPIPEGLVIDHLCRNRRCVNPDHLEAVTNAENVRRGVGTRLDHAKVREIRASTESIDILAVRYGVGRSTVHRARTGETWSAV